MTIHFCRFASFAAVKFPVGKLAASRYFANVLTIVSRQPIKSLNNRQYAPNAPLTSSIVFDTVNVKDEALPLESIEILPTSIGIAEYSFPCQIIVKLSRTVDYADGSAVPGAD